MLLRPPSVRRPGASAVLTLFLLLPLLLVAAFALDLNYIWVTDAELQNAADAAALAGASRLVVPGQAATSGTTNASQLTLMKQSASQNATDTAQAYAQRHWAGGAQLVLNRSDVVVGADYPPADTSAQFPNYVRVTVRRDATVSTGPLPLFFGGMFGTPTSSRQATAVATLRSQNVTGFSGSGSTLLPLAINLATYNWLRGNGPAPLGMLSQDLYTVRSPVDSLLTAPANVVKFGDGIPETAIFPNATAPGNFGLVSLSNAGFTTPGPYANWIQSGPSALDLISFGAQGLQATPAAPLTMYGGPGLQRSLNVPLQSIVGQPRTLMVYSSFSGRGINTSYQVVGFVGATVVAADLQAATPYVTVQLSLTLDLTATRSPGTPGSADLVYTGISLSR